MTLQSTAGSTQALGAPQKAAQRRQAPPQYRTTHTKKKPSAIKSGASKGVRKGTINYGGKTWKTGGGGLGSRSGYASYYWQGSKTANGERYNPAGISCAHRTLPFGTMLKVSSPATGRSVVCRVNDRGPFIQGRIVDLSRGAAAKLGMLKAGVVPVTISVQ